MWIIVVVREISSRLVFVALGAWIYSLVMAEAICVAPERRPITNAEIFEEGLRPLGPEVQETFVETVSRHRDTYLDPANDYPGRVFRKSRAISLCQTFNSRFFRGWQGKLVNATTTEGQSLGRIKVELRGFGDGDAVFIEGTTMGETGTSIDDTILDNVTPGDPVVVSGEFRYDYDDDISDCFDERSTSLYGSMTDPEYSASFLVVGPAGTETE
jgi:hypothetical protein